MKSAGIVTIHMINNYGAVEQAYALNQYLRNQDIKAKTIDFRTYRVKESYEIYHKSNSIMDCIRNVHSFFYKKKLLLRNSRFHEFLEKNVPMTSQAYYSNEELEESSVQFDYYICGSDQIWNTFCANYSDAFILKFAKNSGNRIAYAASLGADTINEAYVGRFEEELSTYKAISVRENSSISPIEEISRKPVVHVVDPVFLLNADQWLAVSSSLRLNKPYIFFYAVKGDIPGMREYVRNLRDLTGYDIVVVNINLREMLYRNIKYYDAGPAEFISLIHGAKYIVTNSFHASAFSIIFRKKFMVFNARENGSSRIESLLNMCGIQHRQAIQGSDVAEILEDIDYDKAHMKLKPMIEKSKEFLNGALDIRKGEN